MTNLPKLDIAWTPYSDQDRKGNQSALAETGPTEGHANDVADNLEDLAVAISKEGNQP